MNVAVTETFEFMTTVHVPVPLQAPPLQPVNTELPWGDAVSVTVEPELKVAEQVAPQLIPAGELETLPDPLPDLVTESVNVGAGEKVAITNTGAVPMVKVQEPVPKHAPLQPENTDAEEAGDAVRVTVLPVLMAVELVQVPVAEPVVMVQLMPPVPVTVPLPVPPPLTVTVVRLKVALTV
jgi:hypothetical protein